MEKNIDKRLVFGLVAIAVFMSTLDSSIVNLALPAVMNDLAVPFTTVKWVVMIYLLTVSSLLLAFGRLSDIKGRRWVYCRGFLVFTAGSLLCGFSSGAVFLIISRAIQGLGSAMLMACSPALIVDVFPPNERGRAMGIVGTVVATGLTAGPILGGFLVEHFSWRAIFYINIPIGIIAFLFAVRILKNDFGHIASDEPFDYTGALLLAICFTSFILLVSRFDDWGIVSVQTTVLALMAMAGAVMFVKVEKQKDFPVFDPDLLKIRMFILPAISAVIAFIGLFMVIFLMPFYLVNPVGYTMSKAGVVMVTPFALLFLLSPIAGILADHIGSRILCSVGMALLALSMYLGSLLGPDSEFISICWRLAIGGIGMAFFIPPNSAAAMSAVPSARRGIASGTIGTARNMGMVIGVALAGLVFNMVFFKLSNGQSLEVYTPELEPFFMGAFNNALKVGAFIMCIGVVVSYMRGPEKKV